jgi:Rrf2 family protein
MKLTRASSYALHALTFMAQQKTYEVPVASHKIAEAKKIPERFLLKVLKPLVSARVLLSIKGPNGGYRLAKDPTSISMLEVLEAVDGPIQGLAPSVEEANSTSKELNRKLDNICCETADTVKKQLSRVKMADLAGARK